MATRTLPTTVHVVSWPDPYGDPDRWVERVFVDDEDGARAQATGLSTDGVYGVKLAQYSATLVIDEDSGEYL